MGGGAWLGDMHHRLETLLFVCWCFLLCHFADFFCQRCRCVCVCVVVMSVPVYVCICVLCVSKSFRRMSK